MVKSMNTKLMAALAVFAMVFVGFGAFIGGADAAVADDDETTISVVNVDKDVIVTIDMAGVKAADATDAAVEAAFNKVKANTDIYDGADVVVKGVITGIVYDSEVAIPSYLAPYIVSVEGKPANATLTIMADLASFAGVEKQILEIKDADDNFAFTKDADSTFTYFGIVTFAVEDAIVGLYDDEEVQAAIDIAVAFVEAQYAGYLSPEEAQAAIDKAVQVVKDAYKGYKSPEDVKKACDKAVEDYIATHPVKKDDTFLYVTIVLAAIVIALAGFMVFDKVIKPKMAKKDEIQVI